MQEYVKDVNGNIRLIIRKISDSHKQILNKDGMLLGFIRDGSTFDKNGNLIARGENIGLICF